MTGPTPLAKTMARTFGILWIAANLVNGWRIVSAIAPTDNPYEEVGYVGFGSVVVLLIFYCTFHIVALTPRIVLCLKILLVVSAMPVLLHGIIPLEVAGWVVFELIPTQLLLKAFSGHVPATPTTTL
jgi:hypothetical protein